MLSAVMGLGVLSLATAMPAQAKEDKHMKTAVDTIKIYKDSGLEESKKGKDGSVYDTKGQKKINGKQYTKAYQDGKFVGYIDSKKLRAFDGVKDKRTVKIVKSGYQRWGNFYWSNTKGKAKKGETYEARQRFQIGNGKNYYALYKAGEFAGFINANATDQKNVWTTSSAIIMFKRAYKYNSKDLSSYISIDNYNIKDWTPIKNKKNTIVLLRDGTYPKYIKMIASGTNTIMSIYQKSDKSLKNPEVTFTISDASAKIINKK